MRWLVPIVVLVCSNAAAMAPRPVATAWQQRCMRSLEQARVDAARYEPELRTAEVKIDDAREEVILHAGPPVWHVPSVAVFVVHEAKPAEDWAAFAESLHGSLHVMSMRGSAASIMLDGWDGTRASRIEPILRAAVDRCLAP